MRIAQINMCSYGSTGNIMLNIAQTARKEGIEVNTYSMPMFSVPKNNEIPHEGHYYYGNYLESLFSYFAGRITSRNGYYSFLPTLRLILMLRKFGPDIIHLHNLHGFNINLPLLFKYIRKNNLIVVWTFHDCWPFTGHCAHFQMSKCDKWKRCCMDCKCYSEYPRTQFDNSKRMFLSKKAMFTSLEKLYIVTPSKWLAGLVKQSFFKNYPVRVINNGVDLSVFKPRESDVRRRYNIFDRFIVLGVAFDWGISKGIDIFIKLALDLPSDYVVVLVGTNDEVDKILPSNIISIHRTSNPIELAEIYTAADVFVNPTREDTFPTVNIEALACGTPVVTFETGGSPEIIDEHCGISIKNQNYKELKQAIIEIHNTNLFKETDCINRARHFEKNDKFTEYVRFYNELTKGAK